MCNVSTPDLQATSLGLDSQRTVTVSLGETGLQDRISLCTLRLLELALKTRAASKIIEICLALLPPLGNKLYS